MSRLISLRDRGVYKIKGNKYIFPEDQSQEIRLGERDMFTKAYKILDDEREDDKTLVVSVERSELRDLTECFRIMNVNISRPSSGKWVLRKPYF